MAMQSTNLAIKPNVPHARAANLENAANAAASKAANSLNAKYRRVVVEVIKASKLTAPDGGVDILVYYDTDIWETPGEFLGEFSPLLQKNIS